MANPAHLDWLKKDPAKFRDEVGAGRLPALDFSGQAIVYDFSNMRLGRTNFHGCTLSGSKFRDSHLEQCDFTGSDWRGCDFYRTTLNGGALRGVRNADRALNLTTAKAHGFATEFETAVRTGVIWPDWDWERLGTLGRLPLFGVSTTALILLPAYFYVLAHYNHSLSVLKNSIESFLPSGIAWAAVSKLPPLPIPSLSLVTLASALLLAIASLLYSFFCPPIPKQYSLAQWLHELEKSAVTYLAQTWTHRWIRIVCAWCYLLGGVLAVFVLSVKLYQTAIYIVTGS